MNDDIHKAKRSATWKAWAAFERIACQHKADADLLDLIRTHFAEQGAPKFNGVPDLGPLLAFSLAYMDGVMQDESAEIQRHWQRVRQAAIGVSLDRQKPLSPPATLGEME